MLDPFVMGADGVLRGNAGASIPERVYGGGDIEKSFRIHQWMIPT
jgi:hypothetical protein